MLDEYKTPDNFWAEAVNTACHAINRLYLHKIYKKTAYELLTGNKPKVDYFRVFGCKCFILNKKVKSSKFAPRVDEGFLLGYASNAHGYRVFNNTTGLVEIAIDVTFDESNGSQGHVSNDIAGNEEPPCEAIKKLAIGEVRPQEKDDEEGTLWMTNEVVDVGARVVSDKVSTQAKIYKKTAYELLTGNKPKVDYFRVFGCKCFILNKKVKSSKFAPRVDEGFLLGYASNAHGYRVFNNTTGLVEIAIDVTFDESNGSQGHVSNDIAGNEEPPCEAIKKLAIGEVRPQEKDDEEGTLWMTNEVVDVGARVVSDKVSTQANPSTSSHPSHEENHQRMPTVVEDEHESVDGEVPLDQVNDEEEQIQRQPSVPHPRVHHTIQRDHLVDNILGSIRRGVTTRSRLANFCEFYSFVSSLEPFKVEEALSDQPQVIQAMKKIIKGCQQW